MKLTTSAILLALSGAVYAVPLPIGVLDNVQDNCAGAGAGCVAAGPFLHHLADSETKYLHLVHPETAAVTHVVAPSTSLNAASTSSTSTARAAPTNDDEITSTKPAAGVYPSSNHPATSTPFTEPPSISSSNGTTLGSTSKTSYPTADDGVIKPQDDSQPDGPSPVKPAGMAVAPNSTQADQLTTSTKGLTTGSAPATNQTTPDTPAPILSNTPAPASDDAKKIAAANSTNIADATGVAQAPNLVHSNDISPDQKVRQVYRLMR